MLQQLPVGTTATFYFKDLGAQISWGTVSNLTSTTDLVSPKRFNNAPKAEHTADFTLYPVQLTLTFLAVYPLSQYT